MRNLQVESAAAEAQVETGIESLKCSCDCCWLLFR
jgi:hypothetical protein